MTTLQGQSDSPGEADGFGPVDGNDARDLAAAAARHPRTRWCVTALNPGGTAAAHACLPGRYPPPGTGPPGSPPGPDPPPGTGAPHHPLTLKAPLIPIARGTCDHARGETGYHPSRALQHLIRARSATCTAPGCRRPAARCDLDHTVPWDQGGRTCECGLVPALQTITTQVTVGQTVSCPACGSVFRQQLEPLPFGEMTWRDHLKVPPVKGGDLVQVEPLGERYHASIHGLEPQRRVGGEQFCHPPVQPCSFMPIYADTTTASSRPRVGGSSSKWRRPGGPRVVTPRCLAATGASALWAISASRARGRRSWRTRRCGRIR